MTETVAVGEEDLAARLKDSYPYRGDGTGRSEPLTIGGIKLRSDSDVSDTSSTSSKDGNSKRKCFFSQPQGSMEYRVMARDTLDSIALSFDSSPSQLMRLNHLTSRMLFPGQVVYVPDPDAEVPLSPTLTGLISPTSTSAPEHEPLKKMDIPVVSMKPRDVPTVSQGPAPKKKSSGGGISGRSFSLRRSFTRDSRDGNGKDAKGRDSKGRAPLQKAMSMPQPGHPVRQRSVDWDVDDSRQYLKVDVKYITDGEGVVSGTMLITPNAIMFDPNVSDPLVKDRGAGPYGVMTNMDMVLGAAMYHDISAMSLKTQTEAEEKEKSSCPVYVPENGEKNSKTGISKKDGENYLILAQDIRKRLTGCSDESSENQDAKHSKDTTTQSEKTDSETVDVEIEGKEGERTVVCAAEEKLKPSGCERIQALGTSQDEKDAGLDSGVEESQSEIEQSNEEEDLVCPTTLGYQRLQSPTEGDQGTKRFSSDTGEGELSSSQLAKRSRENTDDELEQAEEEEEEGADEQKEDVVDGRRLQRVASDDSEKSLEPMEREMEERLQEIETLLNSDDDRLDDNEAAEPASVASSLKDRSEAEEGTPDATKMPSLGECKDRCDGTDADQNVDEKQKERSTAAGRQKLKMMERSSSQDFVDFSSGLFVKDCRKCSMVPDVKECIHAKDDDERTLEEVKNEGEVIRKRSGDEKSISPVEEATVNGEATDNTSAEKDVTDGGVMAKPHNEPPAREMEYNKTDFRDLLPKKAKGYEDPPLYLCLRTKKPMQKTFSKEGYRFRKNKVPEYWFAIPRVKADNLYAFFLQWSPDLYGKEISPSEVGFVVVQDSEESEELELIEDFFKDPIQKDWEIITREEASKRRMTILECEMNLPLPELVGESTLLCNDYVRKLSKNLPPRTEGYSWVLVFSTNSHGYSLQGMYRNMSGWDTPMLIILRDSEGHLFGALTSCALRVSDHYYGTGESFLYRFKGEELEMFRWTGENSFFIKGDMDAVCIGGGEGTFGLWLDGDLYHGRSRPCKTFNNETLSANEDFIIADMEVWSFQT